jgi:hypothetical protein
MNKSIITGIAGMAIGLSVFGVAACIPDTPVADTPVSIPAPPLPSSPNPSSPALNGPSGSVSGPVATPTPPVPSSPVYSLPACAEEDSTNCYWDAQSRGNGKGTSFVNLNGTTYYPR